MTTKSGMRLYASSTNCRDDFASTSKNIEIVVEDKPARDLMLSVGLDPRHDTLYGLYQGVPLPDRSAFYPPILPDKITIFSQPLLRDFSDPEELRDQIRTTVCTRSRIFLASMTTRSISWAINRFSVVFRSIYDSSNAR